MMQSGNMTPTVLSIAGFDPYGGAGIVADSKVIHAMGGYALCGITAQTAQNAKGVKAVLPTPAEHLQMQLETLLDDMQVDAVKVGMLANGEIIDVVAHVIKKYRLKNIVLDTVLVSSSGKALLEPAAMQSMIDKLFPLADIITPNIPEVNSLTGKAYAGNADEVKNIAQHLLDLGAKRLLIKGGHSEDQQNATDYLVSEALQITPFVTVRLHTAHTHGTGCVLSSAIATNLAKQENWTNSITHAKDFLYKKFHTSSLIKFKYHTPDDTRKEPLL